MPATMLTADFAEPFVPAVDGADDQPLAGILAKYSQDHRSKAQKIELLEAFLKECPDNPWAPSVRLNLGLYYHQSGRFTRAMPMLEVAWQQLRKSDSPRMRALADHAVAEYALTLAHLGRYEELEPLLTEVRDRPFRGAATELIASAREGLRLMNDKPELSFLCGPLALRRCGEALPGWSERSRQLIATLPSTKKGTSLFQVYELSKKVGLNYQMAHRQAGSKILTPSVAHWKAGHFGAILNPASGLYPVGDDTGGYGRAEVRMEAAVLEEEASGYFLVPAGPLPKGWRSVSEEEARGVWGRGNTGVVVTGGASSSQDYFARQEGGASECMTTWNAHVMLASLSLRDTPVGLSPARFAVPFQLNYSQRDIGQPAVFTYTNFGPKWTCNWIGIVTDNLSTTGNVELYERGGGLETFAFRALGGSTLVGNFSQTRMTRLASGAFLRDFPDGSREEYGRLSGNRAFLTAVADPQGNTTRLQYDSQLRITTITDPAGRVMRLSYTNPNDPLLVTRITDPFGRQANLAYNEDGQLESIQDVIGLESSFVYGPGDFINAMTTPYGTTTFDYGDISTDPDLGSRRFLTATDPEGRTYRVEARHEAPGIANTDPVGAPQGMVPPLTNDFLQFRNSFFWEPQQLAGGLDYTKATQYHFLHAVPIATSRMLESYKKPLQRRVWFTYEGQSTGPNGSAFEGRSDLPVGVGRVLSDGRTQKSTYSYNSVGNVLTRTDPMGRVFTYTYDPNQVDLTSVSTGGQTLLTATYDTRHNILTLTGASGGTSTFTYDTRGLLQTATNLLGQVTTYTYTTQGNLATIEEPLGKTTTFTYDSAERVSTATDSEGRTVRVAYDDADRPLSLLYPDGTSETIAYSRLDVASTTDRMGRRTQMSHDNVRRLISITDANGGITGLGYGLEDAPSSLTDPRGNVTTFQLDLQQRLSRKQYPDGAGQTIVYEFCAARVARITDALGNSKRFTYDLDNQLKDITYSDSTPPVSFTNDSFLPRPLSMTDGEGTTTMTYHPVGSPGANQVASISGPFGDVATFNHDAAGRLLGRNVNGSPESITYDDLWRVTSTSNALDTFQLAYLGKTSQATSLSSGQGPTTQMVYADNIGDRRLQQFRNLRSSGELLSQFDYSRNPIGQITQLTQTFSGNDPGGGGTTGGTSGTGTSGTGTSGTGTSGTGTSGTGTSGTGTSGTGTSGIGTSGTGTSGTGTSGTGTSGIGTSGTGTSGTGTTGGGSSGHGSHGGHGGNGGHGTGGHTGHGNGGHNGHGSGGHGGNGGHGTGGHNGHGSGGHGGHGNYGGSHNNGHGSYGHGHNQGHHGNGGRGNSGPKNGQGNSGGARGYRGRDYQAEVAEQVVEVLRVVWGWETDAEPVSAQAVTAATTTETLDYTYDNLNRLVGVSLNQTPTETYVLDPTGNLTSLTVAGITTNFTYNALNQPNAPGSSLFDPKGQTSTDSQGRTFEWDAEGRVTAIVRGNQRSEFGYDGLSRRTRITELVDGVVVSKKLYWWLGGAIVCERDGLQPGFPITKRYFGQGVLQGATRLYYTFDHLGSVRQLLDDTGNIVADYRYTTYGERTKVSGDGDSDFGYAGLFHHKTSGLDLATYRLYDAKQQRWISRDPLGEGVDYNLYRYCGNDPVNSVDPAGLFCRVDVDGENNVTITIPVAYWSNSLSPEQVNEAADKFDGAMVDYWGGQKGKYNVTVNIVKAEYSELHDAPDVNYIQLADGTGESKSAKGGTTHLWYAGQPPETGAHEGGHLMGLPDLYSYDDRQAPVAADNIMGQYYKTLKEGGMPGVTESQIQEIIDLWAP